MKGIASKTKFDKSPILWYNVQNSDGAVLKNWNFVRNVWHRANSSVSFVLLWKENGVFWKCELLYHDALLKYHAKVSCEKSSETAWFCLHKEEVSAIRVTIFIPYYERGIDHDVAYWNFASHYCFCQNGNSSNGNVKSNYWLGNYPALM